MSADLVSLPPIRFGNFELDLRTRELRRCGLRLKLEEKPFQLLELLVERADTLVTRKELRERLWPDTFVDFDRNTYTVINRLRKTLGDTMKAPRYIETRSRLGYRFVAPVKPEVTARTVLEAVPFDAKPPRKPALIGGGTHKSTLTVPFGTAASPGLDGNALRFQLQRPNGESAEVSLRLTTTKEGALNMRLDFSGVGSSQVRQVSSRRGLAPKYAIRRDA